MTSGWTWIAYDLWQLPRREDAIIGISAFLNGGAAGTVSRGGRIWQDLRLPNSGAYRIFLRVVDFGQGVNRIKVECGDEARWLEWGARRPEAVARILRRLRGSHSLFKWLDAGTFSFKTNVPRVTIEAERAEQPCLFIDALYATGDATEDSPRGWHPCARPVPTPAAPVKRRRTVVSAEQIESARSNVRRFGWAHAEAATILRTAKLYAERSDEEVWRLMPSSTIPRADRATDNGRGCPEHGRALEDVPTPWNLDPFGHPYQVQCAIGGEWYPRRLDAADTESVRRQARREAATGKPRFIRHYCHQVFLRHVRPAAEALARAYAITGESVYAHKAAVLLCRVASEYPDSFEKRYRVCRPPYSVDSGMFVDTVLSGHDLTAFATSYDLTFDAFTRDSSLVGFLRGKLPDVQTAADTCGLIEERLLRTMAQAVIDGAIRGNPGAYETGVATVALCLDDFDSGRFPDSREMIRALYYDHVAQHGNWGIPARYLNNVIHPNGCTDGSVDYGSLIYSFADFGERMEQLRALHPDDFDGAEYPSILYNPRLRRHIDFLTDVVCLRRYHPALGDGHGKKLWTGHNLAPVQTPPQFETLAYPDTMYKLFRARPDAALARLLVAQAEFRGDFPRDLFDRPREDDVRRSAQDAPGRSTAASLLDDHRVVLIRAGTGEHERVLTLNYRSGTGDHRHADALTIGLFGHGLDLLPELPHTGLDDWRYRANFELHPLLHNTITFDRAFEAGGPAYLQWLHETPSITVASARSPESAPARFAERTCALVNVDDPRWYVLDVVTASGGSEHHLSVHVPLARQIEVDGVELHERRGTLAAESGRFGDATTIRGSQGGLHPFCFMTNVSSGRPGGLYVATHRLGDADDVHLRVWGLAPPDATLTFADASPPVDPAAYKLRYMFAHRDGVEPLESRFVHVLEPYRTTGFIRRVERIEMHPADAVAAVRVVMDDRIDVCIVNPGGARIRLPDGSTTDAVFVHQSQRADRMQPSMMIERPVRREILAVDRGGDAIIVSSRGLSVAALLGRPLRIHNEFRSSMYRVIVAEHIGGDRLKLRMDRSSLLGEGRAVGFEDGVVLNTVPMPLVAAGCTLQADAGSVAWRVRGTGHVGHKGPDILVSTTWLSRPGKKEIADDFHGRPGFSVHAYGPGDAVEISRLTS